MTINKHNPPFDHISLPIEQDCLWGPKRSPVFLSCHLKEGLLLEKKNMQIKVLDQERFKVAKNQFIVGPSANGYTLAYSADGVNFTEYTEATPAGENLIVNGVPQYAWCKLVGNEGEVDVIL